MAQRRCSTIGISYLAEHRKAKKITVTRSDNRTQMSEQPGRDREHFVKN